MKITLFLNREFRERMRAFAQFYTAQEYEQFLTNLERERELRLRLTELNRYRDNGITRHEECAHFEQVMAQTQSQTETSDHWTEKKSVSSCFHSIVTSWSYFVTCCRNFRIFRKLLSLLNKPKVCIRRYLSSHSLYVLD